MDVDEHDGSGVAGESQASQILKNAMERGSEEEEPSARTIPVDEPDISKDLSSDSFNPHSAPKYHYHGLATTQTQSQSQQDDESNLNDEGSQTENNRAALSSSGNQVQRGAVQSPIQLAKAPQVEQTRCLPTKSTTNTKTVSFDSPKAAATPIKLSESRSSGLPLRHGDPTPKRECSPDSFAGGFEDPAEKFIASSKQFDIPLAQLGVASPSVERSPLAPRRAMYADDIPSVERSPKVTRSGMDTNDEEGTILVNSTPTPSNSGSSQSQSQPRQSQPHSQSQSQDPTYGESDDYSLYNAHQPEEDDRILPPAPDSGSQDSTQYPSSELSSSYRRLYEPLTPALESTQILEPTQPIDESTQIMEATQLVEERSDSLISFKPEGVLRGDTFSNATSTAGHAKTLLDSLDPSKRNRYAGHLAQVSRVDRDPADASVTNYSSSAARGGYLALPDARPPHWSAGNSKPSTSSATRLRRALVDERTEVIPDSEPPREGSLSPVPPLKPSTRSPPKPRPRPASSDTETDTEIIPDSMDVDGADRNEVVGILNAKSTLMREEEEEEEEEEEVPLSKRTGGKHADLKGKGKAVDMGPPPIKPKDNRARSQVGSPAIKPNRKPKNPLNPPKKRRTREVSPEVPSSVPDEDDPAAGQVTAVKPKMATRAKSAAATRVRKKVGRSTKRGAARNETDEEESSEDELLIPKSEGDDEEVSTEPADDDYMVAGPSTRKRKRGTKAESPNQSKALKSSKSSATRPLKRARAASTSTPQPTRVFALWRKDGNFYSGFVHSQVMEGRYKVQFDDGTSDDVRIDQMRLCDPRVGDTAFVATLHRAVKITAVLTSEEKFKVEADSFWDMVLVSQLRIGSRTITSGWADRVLTADAIVCAVKPPRSLISPSPSRNSVFSAASSRRCSDLFAKIGFCITHALEAEQEKEAVASRIKKNGGVVIDDWDDMITMKGKQSSTRWTLEQKDARPMFHGVERVFLLSDDASQTPKFLLALALGIPCLRVDFVAHAIETGELTDWMMYLLPSGFSETRNCRVSQWLNADFGEDVDDIKDIMNNPVAHKVFRDKKILCVGAEVITFSKGKKNANLAIARIILAMGAATVEAVREIKHASCALSEYDYIVNKDNNTRVAKMRESTVVPWDWVKDALISGCLPAIRRTLATP